jgi:hypothetical protein
VIDKQNRIKIRIEIGAGMKPKKGRNSADNITTAERLPGSTTARLVNDYLVNDCPALVIGFRKTDRPHPRGLA